MLVIMSDQHNPKMLGCRGHDCVSTPNLDALAARGTLFDQAYTNSPLCVPARASIATGRYVHDHRCWDNAIAYSGVHPSWGHRLQEAGNPVVSIGKLHYRSEQDDTGFDEQIIPMHIMMGVGDLHGSIRPNLPVRYQARQYVEEIGPGETKYQEYDIDITNRACAWLRDRANNVTEKPWVLFVSMICPHFPIVAPQKFYDMYPLDELPEFKPPDTELFSSHPWWKGFNDCFIYEQFVRSEEHRKIILASYLGLCSFLDENVGKVLNTLDESGLNEITRVIYLSDHGDNMGARRIWGKSTMHEESAGVPIIMAGPDIPEATVCRTPVSLVDMYPTILDAAGIPKTASEESLPGESLMRIASDPLDANRRIFSEYHGAGAISGVYMFRSGRYKYVHYAGGYAPELYDLETDPEELHNIASDPDYCETLRSLEKEFLTMYDAEEIDKAALSDQALLIEQYGGREAVIERGAANNTPVPGEKPVIFKLQTKERSVIEASEMI